MEGSLLSVKSSNTHVHEELLHYNRQGNELSIKEPKNKRNFPNVDIEEIKSVAATPKSSNLSPRKMSNNS